MPRDESTGHDTVHVDCIALDCLTDQLIDCRIDPRLIDLLVRG